MEDSDAGQWWLLCCIYGVVRLIVEHRLRKFQPEGEADDPVPRLLWVRWFKTRELSIKAADEDAGAEVVWVGDTGLTETNTYDIKRYEMAV